MGSEFPRICNGQNSNIQTVIPGRHQISGATERGRMYFKDITLQITDNEMISKSDPYVGKSMAPGVCYILIPK